MFALELVAISAAVNVDDIPEVNGHPGAEGVVSGSKSLNFALKAFCLSAC
ncbi:MAG: hypothetical protein DHS20C01_12290 [marine bacterium B5-7]|nr:MAG: hypothetical protein DHS20C01_12290 [marine bacterium B5-7]